HDGFTKLALLRRLVGSARPGRPEYRRREGAGAECQEITPVQCIAHGVLPVSNRSPWTERSRGLILLKRAGEFRLISRKRIPARMQDSVRPACPRKAAGVG